MRASAIQEKLPQIDISGQGGPDEIHDCVGNNERAQKSKRKAGSVEQQSKHKDQISAQPVKYVHPDPSDTHCPFNLSSAEMQDWRSARAMDRRCAS